MVMVDGRTDAFNGSFFGYFPDKVKVHPGDSIVYHSMFQGEPHSVAFGNLVDDAVSGFMTMTPEQMSGEAPPPDDVQAAFAMIPAMLPDGPGDAIQTSINPCFVAAGDTIPSDPAVQCPVTEAAPFDGTEEFYDSGFLPDGETFLVQLADDIPPGTYYAMCTLHFTEMISEITVVPADEPIPTPDDVLAEGQAQFEELAAFGPPAIEEANAAATPGHVHAGLGSEEAPKLLVTEFVPLDTQAAVGDPVTFSIAGPHTVSFNAPESARTILVKGDDGGFHLVPEALAPAGYEPPPPPEGEPSSDAPPPPLDGGTWDGTGFFSSGIMFGGDFVLRFSAPGTYEYQCLIHPEMQGTVTVT
jgi:plastocyanin